MTSLKIHHRQQINNYYCGPASLQMALGFFDFWISQKKLATELSTNKKLGTSNKKMLAVAKKYGFQAYSQSNSKISDIKFFLANNFPVIVNFIEPKNQEGHFAVVSALSKNEIKLSDPYNGKNFKLRLSDFNQRWRDQKNVYKKWFMVVCPKIKK